MVTDSLPLFALIGIPYLVPLEARIIREKALELGNEQSEVTTLVTQLIPSPAMPLLMSLGDLV